MFTDVKIGGLLMNKKPYHHGDLRTAMIEKGIELINENGSHSLSLRKVAAACGVSHAAPYTHFPNRDDLMAAIENHITEQFSAALESAVIDADDSPISLFKMGQAYILFFSRNPQYFSFLFSPTSNHPLSLFSESNNVYKPLEVYKTLVTKLLNQINFPNKLQTDTIVASWAFVHGLAAIAILSSKPYDEEFEQRIPLLLSSMRITLPNEREKMTVEWRITDV